MKIRDTGQMKLPWISMVLFVFLLSACSGPSTKILPYQPRPTDAPPQEDVMPLLGEVNAYYLQESLDYLSRSACVSGSEEEKQLITYAGLYLNDYGYEVVQQQVRLPRDESEGPGVSYGTNLIAIKNAADPGSDILIISNSHDTVADSPGAGSRAAAMSVWLECARLLATIPTDTQIRFVSFTGSENYYCGSREYVRSLTTEEKRRIIGVVQLDELGDVNQDAIVLGSVDGEPVMVGDMLAEAFLETQYLPLDYRKRRDSDAAAFVQGQVPAVSVSQPWRAYEYHLPQDRLETIDVEKLVPVAEMVARMAARIMGMETPSLTAKSRFVNDLRSNAYIQEPDQVQPFGGGREMVRQQSGLEGALLSSVVDDAGVTVDTYQYLMKWFDVDQVILTSYYFQDDILDTISLDAAGAGVDFDEMKGRLSACYGDPVGENAGPYGIEYDWIDPLSKSFFALIPRGDGYDVEIREYPSAWIGIARYSLDGTPAGQYEGDQNRYQELTGLAAAVLAPDFGDQILYLDIFTDGLGGQPGYVSVESFDPEAGQSVIVVGIDGGEAFLRDGSWRDYSGTEALFVEYYGRILEQTMDEEYVAEFRQTFGGETGEADFAGSFRLFVLCQYPETMKHESDARIRFFYNNEALTEARNRIREQLKLVTDRQEEAIDAGEN